MVDVSPYFGNFPKVDYKVSNDGKITETATDLFKRYGILREVLSNATSYVLYEVEDGDTPEILAEKMYGDAGAGWIILYANQIIDPQFDWPLSEVNFRKYISEKYGSVANAQITIHHYEKVVETTVDDQVYTRKYLIEKERFTENALDVPYTYYTPYIGPNTYILTADSGFITADNTAFTADHSNHAAYNDTSLPEYFSYDAHNVDGKTVYHNTYGNAITNYDFELNANDNKKIIKVIKKQYYSQIISEFKNMNKSVAPYIRVL